MVTGTCVLYLMVVGFCYAIEEIEAVFKSGGGADQVITQAILKGANESIRNVYQNVADKYQVGSSLSPLGEEVDSVTIIYICNHGGGWW